MKTKRNRYTRNIKRKRPLKRGRAPSATKQPYTEAKFRSDRWKVVLLGALTGSAIAASILIFT